jgi:glycosyltransferase involved in cell wall biosynthesis
MKAKFSDALPPALRFWLKIKRLQFLNWRSARRLPSTQAEPFHSSANVLRIIVFDDHVPAPDRDAGSARMALILKSFAQAGDCTFLSLANVNQPQYEQQLIAEGVKVARLIDYERLLKERPFHLALMSRADVAAAVVPSLRKLAPEIKTIFDTVDVISVRLEREYEFTKDKNTLRAARKYQKLEKRLVQSCDQIWCVTHEDQTALSDLVPETKFAVIPTIHPLQDRGKQFANREGLLFIGNYLHRPNVDAIHYFMREIYPTLRQTITGARLFIVGDNVPPEIKAFESDDVTVTGYVADVDPIFQSCRVFIAPLRFGSGIKGKIGQALSYGLPVVTTSIGAEGMDLENDRDAVIADGSDQFAASVSDVYNNATRWQRLSDSGYRHIAQNFTPEIVEEKIQHALNAVLPR